VSELQKSCLGNINRKGEVNPLPVRVGIHSCRGERRVVSKVPVPKCDYDQRRKVRTIVNQPQWLIGESGEGREKGSAFDRTEIDQKGAQIGIVAKKGQRGGMKCQGRRAGKPRMFLMKREKMVIFPRKVMSETGRGGGIKGKRGRTSSVVGWKRKGGSTAKYQEKQATAFTEGET